MQWGLCWRDINVLQSYREQIHEKLKCVAQPYKMEVLTEVALVRGQVQDVADILGANQRALSVINQRLDDFDAAVESVNRFRSQLNERMVELERSAAD